jgi:hypothetical protein
LFGDAVAAGGSTPGAGPMAADAEATDGIEEGADVAAEAPPPPQRLRLTTRQQRRLWRHVAEIENFWQGLNEIEPGIIARLKSIAVERRWELIFLTKRPEGAGATAQVQTQCWLESKGFTLPSVFVVQGSRGLIASALHLDVVIDDRPENCLDVVMDSKSRSVLVWRYDPNQLPNATQRIGIDIVKSMGECLDILTHVDAGGKDEPGIVARVRKLLGLRQPAGA